MSDDTTWMTRCELASAATYAIGDEAMANKPCPYACWRWQLGQCGAKLSEYVRTHCVCKVDDDGNIASMCAEHKYLIHEAYQQGRRSVLLGTTQREGEDG